MTKIERVLALDIGGGTTKMGIVDVENGTLHEKKLISTPSKPTILMDRVREYAKGKDFQGFGVAAPGEVDGVCVLKRMANLLNYRGMCLDDFFNEKKIPNKVENDANCVALAEYWERARKGTPRIRRNNLIALSIGTGVGAGVIIRGRLYTGQNGNGGEVGHMIMDFREGKTFEQLCAEHDTEERELAKIVGRGIANIVNIFDIHEIVLGGGKGTRLNIERVKNEAEPYVTYYVQEGIRVSTSSLGEDAQLFGAAYNLAKSVKRS